LGGYVLLAALDVLVSCPWRTLFTLRHTDKPPGEKSGDKAVALPSRCDLLYWQNELICEATDREAYEGQDLLHLNALLTLHQLSSLDSVCPPVHSRNAATALLTATHSATHLEVLTSLLQLLRHTKTRARDPVSVL
jgi:hypothetical protein